MGRGILTEFRPQLDGVNGYDENVVEELLNGPLKDVNASKNLFREKFDAGADISPVLDFYFNLVFYVGTNNLSIDSDKQKQVQLAREIIRNLRIDAAKTVVSNQSGGALGLVSSGFQSMDALSQGNFSNPKAFRKNSVRNPVKSKVDEFLFTEHLTH